MTHKKINRNISKALAVLCGFYATSHTICQANDVTTSAEQHTAQYSSATVDNTAPLIGAYLPHDGWSVSVLKQFKEKTQKNLAYINVFSNFSHRWEWHLKYQTKNIANSGSTPMITWMPIDYSRRNANILPEIISGKWDSYIKNWAKNVILWAKTNPKNLPDTLLLRFAHEFNGAWYSYGNSPYDFVEAWRRVYDLFEQVNANQYVQWIWSPNNVSVDDYNDIHAYYPGDAYVDWTAIDGYNWGSNYSFTHWKSFTEVFANTYLELVNHYPSKPIMIAEFGCADPRDKPLRWLGHNGNDNDHNQDKNHWIHSALLSLKKQFPAIRAVTLFNQNKSLSWALYGYSPQGFENRGITGLKAATRQTALTFDTPNQLNHFSDF